MTHTHRASGRHVRWRVLAVVLALAGAACLVMWADRSTSPADAGAATRAAGSSAASTPESTPESTRQPRPVRLDIAGIGVSTDLVRLGLAADGTVEVPTDPLLAGWYRLGPAPGAHGTAVILGHVDSVDGPAVFARLAELVPGDRMRVLLDDGSTADYAVRTVRTYANADFPAERVYGGTGRRELNLVTCGGVYDPDRGGYQANVVVNARWISGTRS